MNGYLYNYKYYPPNYSGARRKTRQKRVRIFILLILVFIFLLTQLSSSAVISARASPKQHHTYLGMVMHIVPTLGWPCMEPHSCDGDSYAMSP